MAGNKEGAQKARETNKKKYGPDYYSQIASLSWKNPNRSRKTGFALLSREKHVELSKKGGKKTKSDYKKKEETTASTEADKERTGVSE